MGNGAIGAMLYGHIRNEQILINHERLWRRQTKPELADVSDLRQKLCELLRNGHYDAAANLLPDALQGRGGAGRRPDPYQPLGWLHIDLNYPGGVFKNYRRGVDFTSAEAWAQWEIAGQVLSRRCFVSRKHDVVVVNHSSNAQTAFDASMHFLAEDRFSQARLQLAGAAARNTMGSQSRDTAGTPFDLPVETTTDSSEPFFWYSGLTDTGVAYGMVGRLIAPGGCLTAANGCLSVAHADELLVLLKVFVDEPADAAIPRLRTELEHLPDDYATLLQPHKEIHAELFNRCRLKVGHGDNPTVPNEDLLATAYDSTAPTALLERMYHFGRYLLICSTGELPANLQGVWNGDYSPAWSSDYHNDENIQMNYWQACPGNMPELVLPLMDYYTQFMADYRENARKLYGARGIMLPAVQTTHALPRAAIWVYWTAAAGWMAQHFYDYYQFTGDTEMLRSRILPWLKECLAFYEDFLVEDENGELEFCPSLSPENTPAGSGCTMVTINATMDVAVCREVLTNLEKACETLGDQTETIARCEAILTQLPEYEINEDGALREWLQPDFPDNYHHRHQSHLYPVFPGLECTEESHPELFEACRQAVEKRLVVGLTSQTGWSMVHMANIYARLGQGNRAAECLDILTRAETACNLLTYHNDWRGMGLSMGWLGSPPYQIDANFGMTAAVLEMLVVSTADCIRLLPGLPDAWERGHIGRIAGRGRITVSMDWDMPAGRIHVEMQSMDGGSIGLRCPHPIDDIDCNADSVVIAASPFGDCYRQVTLPPDERVTLQIYLEH